MLTISGHLSIWRHLCNDVVLSNLPPDVEVLPCPEGDVDSHQPPQGGQDGLPVGSEARHQYCQQTRGGERLVSGVGFSS